MADLRPALALAKQYRTCPPLHVIEDPDAGEFAKEHLSICPYCRAERGAAKEWGDLVDALQAQFPAQMSPEGGVRPGQIRFLRTDLAAWRSGCYYNPPAVLIIEKTEGVPDGYRVAQVYQDVSLAAPGDLVVDDGRTGVGDLMIECWNTYSMKGSYLGPVVGWLSEDTLAAVIRMETDLEAAPAWAVRPPPMQDNDVRLFFRELEVEVGFVFASAAADDILAEMERSHLAYVSAEEMKRDVARRSPGISWPERFDTLEEGLAAASLPIERYALAAADEAYEELPVNLVLIQAGAVKDILPLHAEIVQHSHVADGLIIGGRIIGLPSEQGEGRLLAFLVREGRTMLAAAATKFEWGTGRFTTTFKTTGESLGSLKIAVFCHIDDD
jgi:hypothetical protein